MSGPRAPRPDVEPDSVPAAIAERVVRTSSVGPSSERAPEEVPPRTLVIGGARALIEARHALGPLASVARFVADEGAALEALRAGGADLVVFADVALARACLARGAELAGAPRESLVPDSHARAVAEPGRAVRATLRAAPETRSPTEDALWRLVAELEAAKDRYRELATVDALTEVLNRRGLEQALALEASRAVRNAWPVHAVLVDCDDFKSINETYGHAAGDTVLATVARRLRRSVRPSDYVARVGGDEFVILLPEVRGSEARLVSERVCAAVARDPVVTHEAAIAVTVSIGVSAIDATRATIANVLRACRESLEESKRSGKNVVTVQSDEAPAEGVAAGHEARLVERVRLEDLVLRAPLGVASQPIRRIAGGGVVGHELWTRGPQPECEAPSALFALARDLRLSTALDRRCLETCVRAALRTLPADARLHFNVLPATLGEVSADELCALLHDPRRICLEVSEQQLVGEPGPLVPKVRALRRSGVRLGLDDVGFGRSSLETLLVLAPEIVKIDRGYLAGATVGVMPPLRRLVRVLEAVGAEIVMKGVETVEELEIVGDLGVPFAQGYVFDKPERLEP
jgi:diguanylate cyclase (GGDEF)-like protein